MLCIMFWTIFLYTIVVIPMGTNGVSLVLFCYEICPMLSVEAFNFSSRYQDDLLNNDNSYFEQMVKK